MIIFGLGGGEVVVYYIVHSTLKFGKNTIIGEDTTMVALLYFDTSLQVKCDF